MRKAVAFNPHWVGDEPAWDIRLISGDIHRSVTRRQILKISSRKHSDVVRDCDIEDYGKHYVALRCKVS